MFTIAMISLFLILFSIKFKKYLNTNDIKYKKDKNFYFYFVLIGYILSLIFCTLFLYLLTFSFIDIQTCIKINILLIYFNNLSNDKFDRFITKINPVLDKKYEVIH